MQPHPTRFSPLRRALLGGALGLALLTGLPDTALAAPKIITAPKAMARAKADEIILIDIRTPQEWRETGVGEGAVAIDMRAADFVQDLVKLRQLYPSRPIAMICRTGARSTYVTTTLDKQGFPGLINVNEGMVGGPNGPGWITRGLPTYPGTPSEIAARLKKLMSPAQ